MKSQSVEKQILALIARTPPGEVITPPELVRAGVGSRAAVDQALRRLTLAGKVRRLGRGLYYKPVVHHLVGELAPTPAAIASAITRGTGERIQISELEAANSLGLSQQVPARSNYWTSGPSRTRRFGNLTIVFRHGSPARLAGAEQPAGTLLQAVRFLGPERARKAMPKLRRQMSADVRRQLARTLPPSPEWLHHVARELVKPPGDG